MNKPKAYSYIRFSTPEQKKGDSKRRQTVDVNPQAIATKLNLPLDDTLHLTDEGKSGWKGEHRTKGALGEFEKKIESGEIAPGSVLIIETWDRLTREALLEAVHLMTGILLKDIGIYTGMDDKYYTKNDFDFGQLVLSANKLQAGHEESEKKSKRGKSNWKKKRKEALEGDKKLSEKSPAWMDAVWSDPIKKTGHVVDFKLQPKAKETFELLFSMKADGVGNGSIAKRLNKRTDLWSPPETTRGSGDWRKSYIQKIVHNEAVIGHFTFHTKQNGKRQAVKDEHGEDVVITDYYPPVVSEDTFLAVQNYLKRYRKKHGHPGGQNKGANNLFVHLVKCGLCGRSMHYDDKGSGPKGRKYLQCYDSRSGALDKEGNRVCTAPAIGYNEFQAIFFEEFEELDISSILPDTNETQQAIINIEQKISANRERIQELRRQQNNLTDSIAQTDNESVRKALEKRLGNTISEGEKITADTEDLTHNRTDLQQEQTRIRKEMDKLKEVHDLLESADSKQEEIDLRRKLRGAIKKLVERIDIYPLTEQYQSEPEEVEPGVYKVFHSRFIDKIRITFHATASDVSKRIIPLKRYAEQM